MEIQDGDEPIHVADRQIMLKNFTLWSEFYEMLYRVLAAKWNCSVSLELL